MNKHLKLRLAGLCLIFVCACSWAQSEHSVRITVTLARDATPSATSGRLLILMSRNKEKPLVPSWDRDPQELWMAAKEVAHLAPGESVEVDSEDLAFPAPFSKAPAGEYKIRAVLDTNHNFAYTEEEDEGDIRSGVSVERLPASRIAIKLTQVVHSPAIQVAHAEELDFESRLLSQFWGRPVHMRGLVVLPPSYAQDPSRTYPTLYWTHGFGGTLRGIAEYELQYYYPYMEKHERPEMIYVLLDQSCPFGTHEFANSVNNGPWGDALVTELIPALESKYRMDRRPSGRLLNGHSSGGWAALWLQVTYPDVFGGAWPTSPDPSDFRAFTPVDLSSATNIYHTIEGKRTVFMHTPERDISMEDFTRREMILGEYGGQISSFEAVFSPRGSDGRPMRLFDRKTGEIDRTVALAWEKYDIATILRHNWVELGPKLDGKIHLYVGTADEYRLNEPATLLEQTITDLGGKARFVFLAGRTHENVYENGVAEKIWQEMLDTARPPKQ